MDARKLPAYTVAQAARYLQTSPSTLKDWVKGRNYPTRTGKKRAEGFIVSGNSENDGLSFINLVEIHVILALKKKYRLPTNKVRTAIQYLLEETKSLEKLAHRDFSHDGENFIMRIDEKLISLSECGQRLHEPIVQPYLERIDYADDGLANRLYPVSYRTHDLNYKGMVIDPNINGGMPFLKDAGIKAEVINDRFAKGENPRELALDYGCQEEDVLEAIRWFTSAKAA